MKRVKWLAGSWPISVRQLAQKIRADVLTPEKMSGFLVTRVRENSIDARFIEKIISEEMITDPFGNEISFERTSYIETAFRFSNEFPEVELLNPPRSIGPFTSRMLQICNFEAAWSNLNVDVLEWADNVQRKIGEPITIDRAHVRDVVFDDAVNFEATLTGTKDVRPSMRALLGARQHTLDKLNLSASIAGRNVRVQLSSDAGMQAPNGIPEEIILAVRQALPTNSTADK
ncbi:hypothetical protein ACFPT7_20240 [Acidicapsa dinghuensis]|uniref:Uncharacterized protein n=1 Tax=Acidicapsa dinghuensis TaxID=2218256 RepID=A0ABW1EKB2_9BACT|nr:hypothetical protein [Acidicapsa dinghuensis]